MSLRMVSTVLRHAASLNYLWDEAQKKDFSALPLNIAIAMYGDMRHREILLNIPEQPQTKVWRERITESYSSNKLDDEYFGFLKDFAANFRRAFLASELHIKFMDFDNLSSDERKQLAEEIVGLMINTVRKIRSGFENLLINVEFEDLPYEINEDGNKWKINWGNAEPGKGIFLSNCFIEPPCCHAERWGKNEFLDTILHEVSHCFEFEIESQNILPKLSEFLKLRKEIMDLYGDFYDTHLYQVDPTEQNGQFHPFTKAILKHPRDQIRYHINNAVIGISSCCPI